MLVECLAAEPLLAKTVFQSEQAKPSLPTILVQQGITSLPNFSGFGSPEMMGNALCNEFIHLTCVGVGPSFPICWRPLLRCLALKLTTNLLYPSEPTQGYCLGSMASKPHLFNNENPDALRCSPIHHSPNPASLPLPLALFISFPILIP